METAAFLIVVAVIVLVIGTLPIKWVAYVLAALALILYLLPYI
jgi:hypothetical protein